MLNIRDPRAQALARELADRRGTSMTSIVVTALENEMARERQQRPLKERLSRIADRLEKQAGPNRRAVSKAEIDSLWGQ